MSKNEKIVITVLLILLVIIICCFTLGKGKSNDNLNSLAGNDVVENEIENDEKNTINEVSNEVENTVHELEDQPLIENKIPIKEQGTIYEANSDIGTTDKKQAAIDLVKQTWGEDDTVTFRCDSIESNGEYIIAVVSKESATVKNYFRVNLAAKTVQIDY